MRGPRPRTDLQGPGARDHARPKAPASRTLPVYDTTGPYTDPNVEIDVEKGLARDRTDWVKERGGVEEYDGREIKPEDNGNVGEQARRPRLSRS